MKKITFLFVAMFCMMLSTSTFFGQVTVQVGSGTTTITGSAAMPVSNYVYNYNQQLISAAQYAAGGGEVGGDITKIRYYATNIGTLTVWNQWTVYIGNTAKTEFTSTTDWVPLAELTQVFSGTITAVSNDWFEVTFTAPFTYTGGNIVVAVHEYAPNWTVAPTFRSFTSTANSGIYYRSDTTNPNPSAPPTATGRVANVPQIQFECSTCTPPPAPECATTPFPADGATDVTVGNVTFTWTAPASGPTPTSYNLYAYDDALGTNPFLIGNFPTTSADLTINVYETEIFWGVVPVNIATEATGCDVWSFTTEVCTVCPVNDNCDDATSIVQETNIATVDLATPTAGTIENATNSGLAAEPCAGFTGTANDDVWYSFEALTTDVNVTVEVIGTAFDVVIQLYSGTCGALVVESCADATVVTVPIAEQVSATGLTVGETYYFRVYQYGTAATAGKTFNAKVWTPQTLSVDSFDNNGFTYFPNPVKNTLQLNAQSNIQNVSIFNMLGQEVLRTAPNNVDSTVDMSALQTGAYFVKVTINDRTETVRVIKQ